MCAKHFRKFSSNKICECVLYVVVLEGTACCCYFGTAMLTFHLQCLEQERSNACIVVSDVLSNTTGFYPVLI